MHILISYVSAPPKEVFSHNKIRTDNQIRNVKIQGGEVLLNLNAPQKLNTRPDIGRQRLEQVRVIRQALKLVLQYNQRREMNNRTNGIPKNDTRHHNPAQNGQHHRNRTEIGTPLSRINVPLGH